MTKQAIMIIAHNNIWTLKKIIEILDSQYFDIFIHIDKKSNINPEELTNICQESKLFVYKEINVRWADYSQVECELFLLEQAINNNYDYYHLISGADMPLKTSKEIYNFFKDNKGKEFIHYETKEIPIKKKQWLKYYYIFGRIKRTSKFLKLLDQISINLQKLLFIDRLKNNNLKIMTGANWFSITNELATYVLEKKELIKQMFKYTRSADEIFLQTITYNSKFKNNLYYDKYDDNYKACKRSIDWKRGNPYTYTVEDVEELTSTDNMFARKFNENKDKEIIEKIYQKLKTEK